MLRQVIPFALTKDLRQVPVPWKRPWIIQSCRDVRGDQRRFISEKRLDIISDRVKRPFVPVVSNLDEPSHGVLVEDVYVMPPLKEVRSRVGSFEKLSDFVVWAACRIE